MDKKFPYKVGDEVIENETGIIYTITEITEQNVSCKCGSGFIKTSAKNKFTNLFVTLEEYQEIHNREVELLQQEYYEQMEIERRNQEELDYERRRQEEESLNQWRERNRQNNG